MICWIFLHLHTERKRLQTSSLIMRYASAQPNKSAVMDNCNKVNWDAETPWATKVKAAVGCMHTRRLCAWKDAASGLANN